MAYTLLLKTEGKKWDPPSYHVTRKIPFIPSEKELDQLIAACGRKTATFLQLLKEIGARRGEICDLQWTDVDFERHTVTINNPEKHGNPRITRISGKLEGMLNMLQKKSKYVFGTNSRSTRSSVFYAQRKHIARKLQNPRLLKIGFHTFRHWKATMLYHQTKDIVYVQQFLGHKRIDNTLLYV